MRPKSKINTDEALRNILHVLQQRPFDYLRFGWWWWGVKRLLRTRYGTDQLFSLGDYTELQALAWIDDRHLGEREVLARALAAFSANKRSCPVPSPHAVDPDGEAYFLVDGDVV